MSNDVAESINQLIAGCFSHVGLRQLHTKQLIAGRFGHVGLRPLHTKLFCMQLTKDYVAETSCNQLID